MLYRVPRYRQKLRYIPFTNHPVWVDDPDFNLEYHIRHTALPRPGGMEELKQLVARIMDQPLDRSRPLWENWLVEGLEKFSHVTLDFGGVEVVGQGYCDEVFRVFARTHPEIALEPIGMNEPITFMVARARGS